MESGLLVDRIKLSDSVLGGGSMSLVRRGASRLSGRPARSGQHGFGVVDAAPFFPTIESPRDTQRHLYHGTLSDGDASLYPRGHHYSCGDVLDQCVSNLHADGARHVETLD